MLPFVTIALAFASPVLAAPGDGDWASAYAKATTALAKMSTSDKITMVTGVGWEKGPCVGNIAAIASVSFPELCLQDGPLGCVKRKHTSLRKIFADLR
jgi:beta-glucosidase